MRLAALVPLGLGLACGGGTQLVPSGPHPPHVQEFVEVPYPPPPAQVEEIPETHGDADCAWVSGEYRFRDRHWVWEPGRWVLAQEGCYHAPPVVAWSKGGEPRLYYSPSRWYVEDAISKAGSAAVCPAPRVCRTP